MFKRMVSKPLLLLIPGIVCGIACSGGCSTGRVSIPDTHELPFKQQGSTSSPKQLWSEKLEGKLTDLAVSSESGHVLTTQVLEGQGPGNTRMSLRNSSGKILWSVQLTSPVRAQTLSPKADLLVVGNYEDELIRIDPKTGEKMWSVADSGMCRPIILEKSQQILCFHDDDAVPGVAFSVFDFKGAEKFKFKVPLDLLILKIPRDESRIVLGLVKGRIWILDRQFKKLAERQVEGEIVDLSVAEANSDSNTLEWSALVNVNGTGQRLVGMNGSGKLTWQTPLDSPHQQIELSADGKTTAVYGNGPRGQSVSLWTPGSPPSFSPLWNYVSPRYADYNQRIDLSGETTYMGFEEVTDRTRHSHVVALRRDGTLAMDIPLVSEDGAYLYARGLSDRSGVIVVGTDDGVLTAYPLRSKP